MDPRATGTRDQSVGNCPQLVCRWRPTSDAAFRQRSHPTEADDAARRGAALAHRQHGVAQWSVPSGFSANNTPDPSSAGFSWKQLAQDGVQFSIGNYQASRNTIRSYLRPPTGPICWSRRPTIRLGSRRSTTCSFGTRSIAARSGRAGDPFADGSSGIRHGRYGQTIGVHFGPGLSDVPSLPYGHR